MKMDGEQNSENSFAAGGPSQGSELSVAKPLQLKATPPLDAQDEAAEKGSLTTRVHDKGQTRAVSSQFVEFRGTGENLFGRGDRRERSGYQRLGRYRVVTRARG